MSAGGGFGIEGGSWDGFGEDTGWVWEVRWRVILGAHEGRYGLFNFWLQLKKFMFCDVQEVDLTHSTTGFVTSGAYRWRIWLIQPLLKPDQALSRNRLPNLGSSLSTLPLEPRFLLHVGRQECLRL